MKHTDDYTKQTAQDILKKWQIDSKKGLTESQAKQRLAQYGYNEIKEKEESLWHRIFRRFWGPIPWMIEIAALLSAIVQKWEDFIIITIMLLVNAFLDFFQEHRALNALKALKQKLANEVIVLRDGEFKTIAARLVVPGDIIKLKIGDIIPADVQLLSGDYLLIDQAALTGESLPVSKKTDEVAYANTIVKQGEMLAVIVNTGEHTNFHSVVSLVAKAQMEERSHFQKMVLQIGNFLILITVALVLLIIMVSLFRHENFLEIARFSLVLTVAAIPVALPAVLSVTMAVGALNLARRQAIVSRLVAIEELAGVDIFCSDKTGTLTQNQLKISEPIILDGYDEQTLLLHAALASRFENNDPIDLAIFHYMTENFPTLDWKAYQQTHFTPFDPIIKRTEADIELGEEHFKVLKGAPQVLVEMAQVSENEAQNITKMVDLLAEKGYRTLAVGRQYTDKPLELLGLIPLSDPPREDSKAVIEKMNEYGVQLKMVTGDHIAIAREIGQQLGLEKRAILAKQLSGSGSSGLLEMAEVLTTAILKRLKPEVSETEAKHFANDVIEEVTSRFDVKQLEREFIHSHESSLVEMIENVDIFAQVVPEDKYRIVDTLQKGGHIVGMTGDGVNDAPALKKADCGFAVSNATDAARAAADIILTAPGLSVINHAIEQARITFERMKSYSIYRIAETIRIILLMTLGIVIFNFYPITALMIIILALLNDIPILAIAYDNTKVDKHPVRWNMPELLIISSVLGIAGVISTFLLFYILEVNGFSLEFIQTMIFIKLVVAGHLTIFLTRTEDWFFKPPYPSSLLVHASFWTALFGTVIAVYGFWISPIGWKYALYLWLYAVAWFIFNDSVKMWTFHLLRKEKGQA